jgi:hypothetical protein
VTRYGFATATWVLGLALCGCSWVEGDQPGECSDRDDNDGDSHIDCFDPGCYEDPDCQGDDDDSQPAGDDDSAEEDVSAWVDSTDPRDGDDEVFYRSDVTVDFNTSSVVDPSLVLETIHGITVPGDQTLVGDELTFDPYGDDPEQHLQSGTEYVATITWSTGTTQISFTTSDVGTPVLDPWNDLIGHDFVRDLGAATIVQPPMGMMGHFNYDTAFHVSAIDTVGGTIELFGAPVTGDGSHYTQEPCTPTVAFTGDLAGTWTNPHAEFGPFDVAFGAFLSPSPDTPMAVTLYDYQVSGTFSPDGEEMAGGTMDGLMDTRGLDALVDPDGGEGIACATLDSLGIDCEECPDGSGKLCLAIEVVDIPGDRVTVTSTEPGTEETIEGMVEITDEQIELWQSEGLCPGP